MDYRDCTVKRDEFGCLWLISPEGDILAELFTATEDETEEDREVGGYVLTPLEWEGEPLYIVR